MVYTTEMSCKVVDRLEQFLSSEDFIDIDRTAAHMRFLNIFVKNKEAGEQVDEVILQHIKNELLMHFLTTAESREAYERDRQAIEEWVWPELYPILQKNPGTAQFMLEYGVSSRYICTCLLDMVERPAFLIMMGHGWGHSVNKTFEPIPLSDSATRFQKDPSFSLFRFRTKCSQDVMKKAKRVLMLGGGLAVSLFMRGYPLGELDQEIVIYDNNPEMRMYLEVFLGRSLEEFGIDYRVADFATAFNDEEQWGYYDYVEALGVAAYWADDPEFLYGGVAKVLELGGKYVFDLQTMSTPTLPFDKVIMGWNTKAGAREMHVEDNAEMAITVAHKNCQDNGLEVYDYAQEEISQAAGVVFYAHRPTV